MSKKSRPLPNPLLGYAPDGLPIFGAVAQGRFRYPAPDQTGKRHVGCYLIFICPSCRGEICHGGCYGKPGEGNGHRQPHCNCWRRGYYIREVMNP